MQHGIQRRRSPMWLGCSALLIALACGLAACSSGGGASGTTAPSSGSGGSTAKCHLPGNYCKTGLTVAVTEGYPPYSYQSPSGALTGLEPTLDKAVAKILDVKITFVPESFEDELLGLKAAKYSWVPSLNVTAAREKLYGFVSYVQDGSTFGTLKSSPSLTSNPMSLCGSTISDEVGDVALAQVDTWSQQCTKTGKKAITVLTFPTENAAFLAVESGKAQYTDTYLSVFGYFLATKGGGNWKLTGPKYGLTLVGDAFNKPATLAPYVEKAYNQLIADGQYAKIIKESDFTSANEVTKAQLNPPPGS